MFVNRPALVKDIHCSICQKYPVVGKIGNHALCRRHFSLGRVCHTCDKFFISSNENTLYCSERCTPKISSLLICLICGDEFKGNPGQKYCCKECREANYKKPYILIFSRDAYQCIYCGYTSYQDNIELQLDHIIPRRKGGLDIASNIVTCCRECNAAKRDKMIGNINLILSEVSRRNKKNKINPRQKIKFPKRQYER